VGTSVRSCPGRSVDRRPQADSTDSAGDASARRLRILAQESRELHGARRIGIEHLDHQIARENQNRRSIRAIAVAGRSTGAKRRRLADQRAPARRHETRANRHPPYRIRSRRRRPESRHRPSSPLPEQDIPGAQLAGAQPKTQAMRNASGPQSAGKAESLLRTCMTSSRRIESSPRLADLTGSGLYTATLGEQRAFARPGIDLDLLAKPIDMRFQRVRGHVGIVAPNLLQQHVPPDDALPGTVEETAGSRVSFSVRRISNPSRSREVLRAGLETVGADGEDRIVAGLVLPRDAPGSVPAARRSGTAW